MLIWRPIMAGHVTLLEVKNGVATLEDLMKMNAILDARAADEADNLKRDSE